MSNGTSFDRLPAAVEQGRAFIDGEPGDRLMVILRAPGCAYARRPEGGCTNCGFGELTTGGQPVSAADLVTQLERALDRHAAWATGVRELDLYCSGSFFCEQEIPPEAREALLAEVARRMPGLPRLMLESRPEYVTRRALDAARSTLEAAGCTARLEVGIGLESADQEIREQRIRKGFTLEAFERAASRLVDAGCVLVVYLLLKPLGTGEQEAVDDVLASGRYLQQLAGRLSLSLRVALEPTFVPAGTVLHRELEAGRYAPPSLWSVVAATAGLAALGLQVHVGQSEEGLPVDQAPSGCPRCTETLRAAIGRFNETQDPAHLAGLTCACQA